MAAPSEVGSGSGSSSKGSSKSAGLKFGDKHQEHGESGENLFDRRSSLEDGIFGVLYTLSKENSESRIRHRWVLLKILLDAWQLFTTIVAPHQGWHIDANGSAWTIISVLNFGWLADLGYGAYLAVLYCMLALLALNIGLCVWVAWCFKEQKFPVVWPIKVLQVFSGVFFHSFDVASLNLLQLGISCRYTGHVKPHLHFNLFPDYSCTEMPHIMHAVVSALCLVLFVIIALFLNMAEVEVNLLSRRPMALGHSGAEVAGFAIKVLLTMVDVFLGWRRVAACVYLALSLALAWQTIRWSPNLVAYVNYLKAGVAVATVWCSAVLVALVFRPLPGGHPTFDAHGVTDDAWAKALTVTMIAGLLPTLIVGATISWAFTRYMTNTTLEALANMDSGDKVEDVCEHLDSPRDVEIVARCCRVWRNRNSLDPRAVSQAHDVIKAGLAMFPKSAYMILLHANFMIEVQGVGQSGGRRVQDARKLAPDIMCRFVMFVRQQQASQKAASSHTNDGTMDLVGYVEYQRKQRMVVRLHHEALQAMCNFWRALDASNVSFTHLSKALGKIESSVSQAQAAYRAALEGYGNNPSLVRLYGKFLLNIKNDPWRAAEYFEAAERLEEVKNGDATGPLLPDGTPLGRINEITAAVLVVNTEGEMQMANKQAHNLFGYKRGTLDAKPMAMLLAPHCIRWLNARLKELAATTEASFTRPGAAPVAEGGAGGGEAGLVPASYEAVLVGMHCDRLAFPLKVTLTKASGVGEDSTIIAILDPLPPVKHMASVWVTNTGVMAACDPPFASIFGWAASEIGGASITNVLAFTREARISADAIPYDRDDSVNGSEVIKRLKMSSKAAAEAGTRRDQGSPCFVSHKYDSNPIPCNVYISTKEDENVTMHELRLRLVDPNPTQFLVVNREGTIQHASPDLTAGLREGSGGLAGESTKHLGGGNALGGRRHGGAAGEGFAAVQQSTAMLSGYTFFDFLPAPWKDMHIRFLKDTTVMTAPGRGQWSCRKGITPGPTLELRAISGKPLYWRVNASTSDTAGGLMHIVRMTRSSFEEAMNERRLRLSISSDGTIVGVSEHAPKQMFGFEPMQVVGRGLWDVVKGLPIEDEDVSPAHGRQFLEALLSWAYDNPDESRRVQVLTPHRARTANASSHVSGKHAAGKPAVMQIYVDSEGEEREDSLAALHVDLWPPYSLTGVLELDATGRINSVLEPATRPAGLLFGLPVASLAGRKLVELVSLPPGRTSPTDLLTLHGNKKSSLKANKKDARVKVGPVHVLQAVHSDGQPLALDVQIAGRPDQPSFAILRLHTAPMVPSASLGPPPGAPPLPPPAETSPIPNVSARITAVVSPAKELFKDQDLKISTSGAGNANATEVPAVTTDDLLVPMDSGPYTLRPSVSIARVSTPTAKTHSRPSVSPNSVSLNARPSATDAAPPNPDLIMPMLLRDAAALPVPSVTTAGAAGATGGGTVASAAPSPMAARVKLGDLVKAVDGEGSGPASGNSFASERQRSMRPRAAGPGSNRFSNDPAQLTSQPSMADERRASALGVPDERRASALGVPAEKLVLPGATPPTDQGFLAEMAVSKKGIQIKASEDGSLPELGDANSDAGSARRKDSGILGRAKSTSSFAPARVQDWVSSKGAFYQNSVCPDPKSDDDKSKQSDEDEADAKGSLIKAPPSPLFARKSTSKLESEGRHHSISPVDAAANKASPRPFGDAAPGGNQAPSENDDAASEAGQSCMSGLSGSDGTEYKRGKRFRKLTKMMDSSYAKQAQQRFRTHALIMVGMLAAVHVMCFVLTVTAIKSQRGSMLLLASVGLTTRYLHMVMLNVRSLDVIQRNMSLPNLYSPSDVPHFVHEISYCSEVVKMRYNEIYNSHHTPDSAIVTILYNTQWPVWNGRTLNGTDIFTNITIWDFVTRFYTNGKAVVQQYDEWDKAGIFVADTDPGTFLIRSGPDLWKLSRKVFDALLYEAVESANRVNTLQLVFLAVEGAFVSCMAACYLAYLLRAVAAQRHKLFRIFLAIPVGLTRALASQNTSLLVEDGDDDDSSADEESAHGGDNDDNDDSASAKIKRHAVLNVSTNGGETGHEDAAGQLTGYGSKKRLLARSMSANTRKEEPPRTGLWGVVKRLVLRRRGQPVVPLTRSASNGSAAKDANKRNLKTNANDTLVMLTPFVTWSALVIVLYTIGVAKMTGVGSIVAVHSATNYISGRALRAVFHAQELASIRDPALLMPRRATLQGTIKVVKDAWYTIQLGDNAYKALGNATERFAMVKDGLAYDSPELTELFYGNGYCRRLPEHMPCPGTDYRFYEITRMGVDSMMQQFVTALSSMANNDSMTPEGLQDEHFDLVYNVGTKDLVDGTVQIAEAHYEIILATFDHLLVFHVILFLMLWVIFAGFIFALLNPLLTRISKERRQVAELMSQLPLELDVERLVARALGGAAANNPNGAAAGGAPGSNAPTAAPTGGPAIGGSSNGRTARMSVDESTLLANRASENGSVPPESTQKWKAIIRAASNVSGKTPGSTSHRRSSTLNLNTPTH